MRSPNETKTSFCNRHKSQGTSFNYKWIFISPVKQTRSNPNTIRRLACRFPLLGILQFIMFKIHIFNTCRVPRTRQKPQGKRNYKFVARNNCCLQKFQLHSARRKLVDMLNGGKNLQRVTRLTKHSRKRHCFLQIHGFQYNNNSTSAPLD